MNESTENSVIESHGIESGAPMNEEFIEKPKVKSDDGLKPKSRVGSRKPAVAVKAKKVAAAAKAKAKAVSKPQAATTRKAKARSKSAVKPKHAKAKSKVTATAKGKGKTRKSTASSRVKTSGKSALKVKTKTKNAKGVLPRGQFPPTRKGVEFYSGWKSRVHGRVQNDKKSSLLCQRNSRTKIWKRDTVSVAPGREKDITCGRCRLVIDNR